MSLKDKLYEMQFSILGKNNKLPVGQKTMKSAIVGNSTNGYNLGRLATLSASGVVLASVDSPIQGVISQSTANDCAVLITYKSEDINVLVDAPVGINIFLFAGADGKLTATTGLTPAVAISISKSFAVGAENVVAVKLRAIINDSSTGINGGDVVIAGSAEESKSGKEKFDNLIGDVVIQGSSNEEANPSKSKFYNLIGDFLSIINKIKDYLK